jgi:hypothetical protein
MPSMWMVSRDMVIPFHPLRMAPLGLLRALLNPNSFTWRADGVMVGSLKMAPMFFPAVTASFKTWSLDWSRAVHDRS